MITTLTLYAKPAFQVVLQPNLPDPNRNAPAKAKTARSIPFEVAARLCLHSR